ncbi:MAG TPA: ATP-binding protein [Candidatus Sulfotelmatobacter sp.]|nr:ATP-binding protein [Candidatus Sulfotelmatobacter sp.]
MARQQATMYRVLLIAVGPEVTESMRAASAVADCSFETAAGPVDAIRRLRLRSYDAVLMGPCTTVAEDLALLEEMHAVRPRTRTIILAARTTPDDVVAALRARVFALLSEPFEPTEAASMVRQAVEEKDAGRGIEVVSASPEWLSVRVDCRLWSAERLVGFLNAFPTPELTQPERDDLLVAFREILLNAMEHGARFDPEKVVEVSAIRTEDRLVFHVRDPGPGFQPEEIKHAAIANPPDDPVAHMKRRAAEGMRPGGFGILLVRRIVDELMYNEVGNEVLLIKHTR